MGTINHFTAGPITPVLAYVMSCIGAALGLLCTSRARFTDGWARGRWLILAALAIGGAGIWTMHFIAMLGFSVDGSTIRYDVPRTIISLAVAVLVVGVGVSIVGFAGQRLAPLILGGVITGSGVASMHYLGMSAMQMEGEVNYKSVTVGISVMIAIVASTVALWFTANVRRPLMITAAALIMGVAVCGMHYTGMYAMSVDMGTGHMMGDGAKMSQLLAPLIVGISLFTVIILFIVGLSATPEELREEADLNDRLHRLTSDQRKRSNETDLFGNQRR